MPEKRTNGSEISWIGNPFPTNSSEILSQFAPEPPTDRHQLGHSLANKAIHWPRKAIHNRSGNPEMMENQDFDV